MPQLSLARFGLLSLLVACVFFTQLGSARLWDRDEPRNSRASHEMLARGDWIVPTFNGELRDHKPILLYWGQMTSYLLLGESEFAARFPSAIAAILAVFSVALLASRLSGSSRGINRDGFWAAGALATSLLFVMAGRAATPDACLIAFSTLGITFLVLGSLAPAHPFSSGRVTHTRWLAASAGYTMLGLAALAKGPVGVVLPLAVVHVWWLICRRGQSEPLPELPPARASLASQAAWWGREAWLTFNPWQCLRALWCLRAIPGLVLVLVAAAPWYIAVGQATNGAFLRGFFLNHNVGRAMNSMEGHGGSLLFYPIAFLVGTFPWSLWLIPIALWARRAALENVVQRQMVILSAVWMAVYVVAFSAAGTKLPSYITPCYAGAALIIGGYWRQFEDSWARPSLNWRRLAYALTIVVGLAIVGVLTWLSASETMPLLARTAAGGWLITAVGALGFWWEYRNSTHRVPATWLVGAAAFHVILFGFGAKSVDPYRGDLKVLAEIKADTAAAHWLSIGGMEPSWVHYLGQEIVEVASSPQTPESWQAVQNFLRTHPAGHIIVVGDEAEAALANHPELAHLQAIDSSPRFLRPGKLTIYRNPTYIANRPTSPGTRAVD